MPKKTIAYFYDSEVGNYHFGYGHPMKPHRVRMAHELIVNYGLYQQMKIYKPKIASKQDLMKFHSEPYLNFLEKIFLGITHPAHLEQVSYLIFNCKKVFSLPDTVFFVCYYFRHIAGTSSDFC